MIAIGSDHGGFALKEEIAAHLRKRGFEVRDFGTYTEESCDYPVYAKAVAGAVADLPKKVSGELKLLYSQYRELQSFAQFGSDLDQDTKNRLALGERIVEVLKQKQNSPVRIGCQVAIIFAVINGYLDQVAVKDVDAFEQKLYRRLISEHAA